MSIRNQFSEVPSEVLTHQQEVEKEIIQSTFSSEKKDRIPFHEIKPGINKRRIFPAHPGTKTFIATKVVHWLPIRGWYNKDKKFEVYTPTEEQIRTGEVIQEVRRKPIFNSRIHKILPKGVWYENTEYKDLVEFYIAYATKEIKEQLSDLEQSDKVSFKKELEKKLLPITDWKKGIKGSVSFIFYCNAHQPDGSKVFGKQEVSFGIKTKMDTLCLSDAGGQSILKDKFSHPDTGKAFNIDYKPNESDNNKKYLCSLLWEEDWKLTDEELEFFLSEKVPTLESMFVNSFKRSDFDKQLEGLRNFDSEKEYNFFNHSDFISYVEKFDSLFPKDEENNTTTSSEENTSSDTSIQSNSEGSISDNPIKILSEFSRTGLLSFIDYYKLDLSPKERHDAERIAEDILDELKETKFKGYSDSKINRELKDLIDDWSESLENKSNNSNTSKPNDVESIEKLDKDASSQIDSLKKKYSKKS